MCGISGIVGPECRADDIKSMIAAQAHRGPDASGHYLSPCNGCALGHNRLSIIDLSDAAKQPMSDSTGRYHIVFNGEIYNYRELRAKVGSYPYKTESDTEVLLAGFIKYGREFLHDLVGMFAFAIWDDNKKELFCARDRLGIKPFHYALYKGRFYFASEAKALLATGLPAEPEWSVWTDYLKHGVYDHTDKTFFKYIQVLEPGHTLSFSNGNLSLSTYWSIAQFDENRHSTLEFDEAAEQFNILMNDSVRLRLRSDVPVGVNLSGGLDSSSLFSYVDSQDEGPETLAAFTYTFENSSYSEDAYSQAVPARKIWNRETVALSAPQIWEDIGSLMYHQESPFGGVGTLAYYNLHREIKNSGVTVVLEGQGVDELLAGYSYYSNPDAQHGVYQDGTSFLKPECLSSDFLNTKSSLPVFDRPFKRALNNALYKDIRYAKLPRVLRMNDRLSMAFGIELREPFLDHRVVEFCFGLPDNFKRDETSTKKLLRHAMKNRLPESIFQTQKRAVVTPQREWMRQNHYGFVKEIITSSAFKELGIFDVSRCLIELDRFKAGDGENAFFIWQWINAMTWWTTFVNARQTQRKRA